LIQAVIILISLIVIVIGGYFIFHNYGAYSQHQHFPYIVGNGNKDNLKIELVTQGLSFPTNMAFIDKHNILVLEKNTGAVRLISDGVLRPKPLLELNVDGQGERGLLGLAVLNNTMTAVSSQQDEKNVPIQSLSSSYASTFQKAYVFLYFTELIKNSQPKNVIYRYDWNGNSLTSPKLVLESRTFAGLYHNGGKSPRDHQLYVTIGDLNNPNSVMQNYEYGKKSSYSSVILRINPISGMPSAGNPFLNYRLVDNSKTEIAGLNYSYAYGIRDSFGLAFDPVTGNLWDTENGEDKYDEINLVKPGFNSGWDKIMGPISLNNNDSVTKLFSLNGSYYSDPKFTWTIPIGVTAIEFFNSSILGKEYENNIFVGDINNGNLYYFGINDKDNRTSLSFVNDIRNGSNINQQYYGLADLVADNKEEAGEVLFAGNFKGRITDIKTGPDGYLYVLTYYDGKIYKIMPLG
jgi:glucose/arabinose dehydrogenase